MTADWVTVCDAIISDLQANVTSLSSSNANVHKYERWDGQELEPDVTRQWAVWPESGETAEGLDTGDHLLRQPYSILVWESASNGERLIRDETATATFLQLHNDVRARFYVTANQQLGSSLQLWYTGTEFPQTSSRVRWFRIEVLRLHPIGFS